MTLPNIPTAISLPEARFMAQLARGRRVVEFGALLGFSSIVLASEAAQVVSVDRHQGYGPDTLNAYMSNLLLSGAFGKVRPMVGDAAELAPVLPGDLAFVDLLGTYTLTRKVIERIRTPLLLVHDFERPNCDVVSAIKDSSWTPIQQVDTLILCERKR